MFYIGFKTAARVDDEGWRHAMGGIELGSESDGFAADLGTWTMRDYESQWREGIARLAAGHPSSALVTSYAGPEAGFHMMWPMWRIGSDVFFHEHLVPADAIAEPVAEHFYAAVGERQTHSDDGQPVSEWVVAFSDLLAFLANS
jgi:hypothetical protein